MRDGPASEQIPKKFEDNRYLLYVNERRDQEQQQNLVLGSTKVKFLVADKVNSSESIDDDDLDWISYIQW